MQRPFCHEYGDRINRTTLTVGAGFMLSPLRRPSRLATPVIAAAPTARACEAAPRDRCRSWPTDLHIHSHSPSPPVSTLRRVLAISAPRTVASGAPHALAAPAVPLRLRRARYRAVYCAGCCLRLDTRARARARTHAHMHMQARASASCNPLARCGGSHITGAAAFSFRPGAGGKTWHPSGM